MIAGNIEPGVQGPVINNHTLPSYMDITLPAHTAWQHPLVTEHNAFIYVIEGSLSVAEEQLSSNDLAVLSEGETVALLS